MAIKEPSLAEAPQKGAPTDVIQQLQQRVRDAAEEQKGQGNILQRLSARLNRKKKH